MFTLQTKNRGASRLKKFLVLVLAAVVLVSAVLCVPTGIPWALTGRSPASADAPQYAVPGPYPVGMRTLGSQDGAPLDLTLWYPAQTDGKRSPRTRYAYQIKMGDPFGTVSITSYTGQALPDAPEDLRGSPYPLVVLSPGFSIGAAAYAWLAEHLASYGLVVIAVEHQEQFDEGLNALWRATIQRPQDILDLFAYLDRQTASGGAPGALIDAERVAVVGHSYGGYTALASGGARIDTASFEATCEDAYASNDPNVLLCDEVLPHLAGMAELAGLGSVPEGLWPAWADPRVDAIVPLAGDALFFGRAGLSEVAVPVMAIGGTQDKDSPYLWGTHPSYEYASSPLKARVALTDAQHMIFTGACERSALFFSFFTGEFCSDAHWDRTRAHDLIKHFTTAFLLSILENEPAAAGLLAPQRVDYPGVEYVAEGF